MLRCFLFGHQTKKMKGLQTCPSCGAMIRDNEGAVRDGVIRAISWLAILIAIYNLCK